MGFSTQNAAWGRGVNVIYVVIMVVAGIFAFHALGHILVGWDTLVMLLAAVGVVGFPYFMKVILFGRKRFTALGAVLALMISLLPWQFDFVGFYSETGVRDALQKEATAAMKVISAFEVRATDRIAEHSIQTREDKNRETLAAQVWRDEQIALLQDDVSRARHLVIDEKTGTPSAETTGVPGRDKITLVRESETRKAEQALADKKPRYEAEAAGRIERAKNDAEAKRATLAAVQNELGLLVPRAQVDEKGNPFEETRKEVVLPLIEQIAAADNFVELGEAARRVNPHMSSISSTIDIDASGIIVSSTNVFEMSYAALLRRDITAWICFLLSFLMEIADIVIAYAVRREDEEDEARLVAVGADVTTNGIGHPAPSPVGLPAGDGLPIAPAPGAPPVGPAAGPKP